MTFILEKFNDHLINRNIDYTKQYELLKKNNINDTQFKKNINFLESVCGINNTKYLSYYISKYYKTRYYWKSLRTGEISPKRVPEFEDYIINSHVCKQFRYITCHTLAITLYRICMELHLPSKLYLIQNIENHKRNYHSFVLIKNKILIDSSIIDDFFSIEKYKNSLSTIKNMQNFYIYDICKIVEGDAHAETRLEYLKNILGNRTKCYPLPKLKQ